MPLPQQDEFGANITALGTLIPLSQCRFRSKMNSEAEKTIQEQRAIAVSMPLPQQDEFGEIRIMGL